jgi:hypothetical protein
MTQYYYCCCNEENDNDINMIVEMKKWESMLQYLAYISSNVWLYVQWWALYWYCAEESVVMKRLLKIENWMNVVAFKSIISDNGVMRNINNDVLKKWKVVLFWLIILKFIVYWSY